MPFKAARQHGAGGGSSVRLMGEGGPMDRACGRAVELGPGDHNARVAELSHGRVALQCRIGEGAGE
jgi:hypothetical protein